MSTTTIESIVAEFEREYGVVLTKLPRKKIIYEGQTRNGSSIVAVMPASKIYPRGNGWVDFTERQVDILQQYAISIAVFRLSDGTIFYVNLNDLFPLMTQSNMMENEKEGKHWKIDIWPNKLVIRNGNQTLNVQPNQNALISSLMEDTPNSNLGTKRDFDFESFDKVEKDFDHLFKLLSATQKEIQIKLEQHSDGKVLKGNELVGWLGEIYTKIVCNGSMVDDSHEHDVETADDLRISVKTRKGRNSGWTRTSAIPKIEGTECPTHLMFVHLNDDYSVADMWLYPWKDILEAERFRKHIVRGNFRSYYMSVIPNADDKYRIYG